MNNTRKRGLAALAVGLLLAAAAAGPAAAAPEQKPVTERYFRGGSTQTVGKAGEAEADETGCRENRIALTFDDGPNPSTTLRLLDGLKERNVRATFFLVGSRVEQFPDVARRIAMEGHLIGSHTYSHRQLTSLSLKEACEDLDMAGKVIFRVCGRVAAYIRPPYGSWNEALDCAVDMTAVRWNIDPEDWKQHDAEAIARHVVRNAADGGIILLHDLYEESVDAALMIVDRLREAGWEFVTVDELILD